MMQNGFRRIALAQGLLPERLPLREVPVSVDPSAEPPVDSTETPGAQSDAWDNSVETRAAVSA